MSEQSDTNARVARVLSATLQATLATQRSGEPSAGAAAFEHEFERELLRASAEGPMALAEAYQDLLTDCTTAIFSVVEHVARADGEDPADLLGELVRTYRRAGRA